MLYFCCVQRTHRLPGIHYPFPPRLCSEVCLWLQLLSGNHIWICWGRPRWLRNPGHTLIPADLRPFLSWGWASHGSLALPDVWRPGFFLCLSCWRPWWSLIFWGETGVFQDTNRESSKSGQEIQIRFCVWPKPLWHNPEPLLEFDGLLSPFYSKSFDWAQLCCVGQAIHPPLCFKTKKARQEEITPSLRDVCFSVCLTQG